MRGIAAERGERVLDVGGDLLALHHRGALGRETLLLAGLDGELGQLLAGVAGEVGLFLARGHVGARRRQFGAAGFERSISGAHAGDGAVVAAIGVHQSAMAGGVEQCALVMLAVNLDKAGGERAQGLRADALVVDIGAGAPVRHLHAAQDQFALERQILGGEEGMDGMVAGQLEHRRHLTLRSAGAHEAAVAAQAQGQRQGVEQDRLAGAGLAGKDRQTPGEIEVELVDQHNVADGEPREHGGASVDRQVGTTMW